MMRGACGPAERRQTTVHPGKSTVRRKRVDLHPETLYNITAKRTAALQTGENQMKFTFYKKSGGATVLSFLGGVLLLMGVVTAVSSLVSRKDYETIPVGVVMVVLGVAFQIWADNMAEKKAFRKWKAQMIEAGAAQSMAIDTQYAIDRYQEFPSNLTLQWIRELNPQAYQYLQETIAERKANEKAKNKNKGSEETNMDNEMQNNPQMNQPEPAPLPNFDRPPETPPAFVPAIPPDATEKIERLKKKKRTFKIILLVFLAAFLLFFVLTMVDLANAPLKTPTVFSNESKKGDYVTAKLTFVVPAYEQYFVYEKSGKKTSDSSNYYCVACDDHDNFFVIKCDEKYYDENLKKLETKTISGKANPIEIFADVEDLSSDVKSRLDRDLVGQASVIPVNKSIQLKVHDGPQKDYNAVYSGLAVIWATVTLIFLLVYLFKRKKIKAQLALLEEYGDVDAIYESACANPVYADEYLVSDGNYILSRNEKNRSVVETGEVLSLYKSVHKTNARRDQTAVTAVNRYGDEVNFQYPPYQEEQIPKIILQLAPLCPRAMLGYTAESMRYIAANKQLRSKKK